MAASIFGLGLFGPHPTPGPTLPPEPSLVAQKATPPGPSAIPSQPSPEPTPDTTDPLDGLVHVNPVPGQIRESALPGQITSQSMAVVGGRLFFVVDGDRIQSTQVGSNDASQTLATVPPCQGINQLAASGHELAYVVTSPGGSTAQVAGCGAATTVAWSVWLLDLNGGSPRQVAHGVRDKSSIEVAEFPIHVAITPTAYAFDRPPSSTAAGPGETVEVHSLRGQLLWTSQTTASVANVMLGGGTLAVLTYVITQADGWLDLWRSDASNTVLHRVDGPASSASISPDGSYLTWDLPPVAMDPASKPLPVVGIEKLDPGNIVFPATLTVAHAAVARNAAVSATPDGLVVAWFATAPGGAVFPALRYVDGSAGAVLPSLQQPIWLNVENGILTWVAASSDGWSKAAYAVDVSSLGLR